MTALTHVINQWALVTIYIIIIVLCTVGNALVLFVILTRKHMRTVTNCFIASMSASDLLIAFVVVSLQTVKTINNDTIHGTACRIPVYFGSVSCTASIYSLLAISFDRYRAVVYSTMKTFTIQKSYIVIVGIWMWSFFYSSKVFILFQYIMILKAETDTVVTHDHDHQDEPIDEHSDEEHYAEEYCNIFVEEDPNDYWFRVTDAIVLFAIPLAAMIFMYIRISRRLWFSKLAVNSAVRKKRNVVKFLIYAILLFFFSWGPFYIVELIVHTYRIMTGLTAEEEEAMEHEKSHVILRFIFVILALSNSFMNPILYAFFNRNLQAQITSLFRRSTGKVFPRTFNRAGPSQISPQRSTAINNIVGLEEMKERRSKIIVLGSEGLQSNATASPSHPN